MHQEIKLPPAKMKEPRIDGMHKNVVIKYLSGFSRINKTEVSRSSCISRHNSPTDKSFKCSERNSNRFKYRLRIKQNHGCCCIRIDVKCRWYSDNWVELKCFSKVREGTTMLAVLGVFVVISGSVGCVNIFIVWIIFNDSSRDQLDLKLVMRCKFNWTHKLGLKWA